MQRGEATSYHSLTRDVGNVSQIFVHFCLFVCCGEGFSTLFYIFIIIAWKDKYFRHIVGQRKVFLSLFWRLLHFSGDEN